MFGNIGNIFGNIGNIGGNMGDIGGIALDLIAARCYYGFAKLRTGRGPARRESKMSKVTYNQTGYRGNSMSIRAAEAYEDGEMPRSKWTKAAMLAALQEWCEKNDRIMDGVEKLRKDDIWSRFFEWKSWHHTGKFAAETDFYGLNEDAAEEASRPMTEAEAEAEEAARKAMLMEREAEEAAIEARNARRIADELREIEEFERITGIDYHSLNGFIGRRARDGRETRIRLAKSGALMVEFDGFEFNLNDETSIRAFIWRTFKIFSGNAKFDTVYKRVIAEAEAMRAQLAEQAAA